MSRHVIYIWSLVGACATTHATNGPLPAIDERSTASPDATTLAADEAALATRADLAALIRIAMVQNPDIAEASARVRATHATAQGTERLPDLELKYEQWGVPLTRPYALNDAATLMIGVRQTFPAAGVRGAERNAVDELTASDASKVVTHRLDVIHAVTRAYIDYAVAERERQIHLAHVELVTQILGLTQDLYRVRKGSEQDVLKLQLMLSMLHRDVVTIELRRRQASIVLNTLAGRAADAPLGPPAEIKPQRPAAPVAAYEARALARRPEIAAVVHLVKREDAMIRSATRAGRWPSIMVGLDYWFQPTSDVRNAYGAMVGINLPWLNGKHQDDVDAAQAARDAESHAVVSTQNQVRRQVHEAYAQVAAMIEASRIAHEDLEPAAKHSLDAARAAYGSGAGDALAVLDALRSLLDVRLDQVRADAEIARAIADLERAAGDDVASIEKRGAP